MRVVKTIKDFEFTPDVKKQLREIAKHLPALPVHVPIYKEVDGEVLLNQGYQKIKINGEEKPVLAGKKYDVPTSHELRDVDHVAQLAAHYKGGGIWAVHGYLISLYDHEQKARENFPHLFEDSGKGKYLGVEKLN